MATKKFTGIPELDTMMAQLNKKFETDLFSDEAFVPLGSIPTGSAALDAALEVGGVAKGVIVEILGDPSSGKTSLCLQILKNAQDQRDPNSDIRDLLVDIEHTTTEEFMQGFGIDTSKVIHTRPETAEQALQIIRDLPKTGKIGIVIVDSVGALETSKKAAKDVGEVEPGGIAKLMHDTCRGISKTAPETGTTFLFINHITFKIGVVYGNPETSPGGQALPFYSCMRFRLYPGKPSATEPGAFIMKVKILKNKCAKPYGSDHIEFPFYYGKGTDQVLEALEMARTVGLLRHSAGQSKWRLDLSTEDWVPVAENIERGKEACIEYFRNNSVALEALKHALEISRTKTQSED